MLKVFVDTNVLLDFFLCREGVDWARSILMKGYDNSCGSVFLLRKVPNISIC